MSINSLLFSAWSRFVSTASVAKHRFAFIDIVWNDDALIESIKTNGNLQF